MGPHLGNVLFWGENSTLGESIILKDVVHLEEKKSGVYGACSWDALNIDLDVSMVPARGISVI